MKLHITQKQYNEVEAKRLIEAFGEYGHHWDDITTDRMLEFLSSHSVETVYVGWAQSFENGWCVGKDKRRLFRDQNFFPELCDGLWKEVKGVLDKQV